MTKRHLKVLQPADDEGESRPAWHWAVIGAVATLIAWLPLAYLSNEWVRRRIAALGNQEAAAEAFRQMSGWERMTFGFHIVLGPVLSLAIAAFLGGLLVGRFGGDAGKNEAMVAGFGVGIVASLVGASQTFATQRWGIWLFTAAVVIICAALSARGGAWVGLRKRG